MGLNCTLALVVSSVPPQPPTDSAREMLHMQRKPLNAQIASVLRRPSKIPELLNSPTVFNKNHGVALE